MAANITIAKFLFPDGVHFRGTQSSNSSFHLGIIISLNASTLVLLQCKKGLT